MNISGVLVMFMFVELFCVVCMVIWLFWVSGLFLLFMFSEKLGVLVILKWFNGIGWV